MPPSAEVASALAGCGTATIVGDSDGVCVVPQASLDRLPEAAAARETKENGISRGELARGRTMVDVLGLGDLIDRWS